MVKFEVPSWKFEVGAEESFPPQNKDFANSSFSSGRDSAAPIIGCSISRAALFKPLLHVREARTVRLGVEGMVGSGRYGGERKGFRIPSC